MESTTISRTEAAIPGPCLNTDQGFTSGYDILSSSIRVLTDSSTDIHHCKRCNKNFNSEQSLSTHLTYHSDNLVNMWMNQSEAREELPHQSPSTNISICASLSRLSDPQTVAQPENNDISSIPSDSSNLRIPSEVPDYGQSSNSVPQIDSLNRLTNTNQRFPTPTALSPMQYDFNQSPMMQSPQGSLVPQGPSSSQSNTSSYQQSPGHYFPEYTQLQTISASQSSGLNGQGSMYPYSNILNQNDLQSPNPYEDYVGRPQHPRFHPYGTSPAASPTVVKEEPNPSEAPDILDLDAARYLGNSSRAAVPQLSGGTMQHIWRPVDQQSNNVPMNPTVTQNGMNSAQVQQGPANMYGNGGLLPQGSPLAMNNLQHGYSPALSSYNPHTFMPGTILSSQPQNYMPQAAARIPSPVHQSPATDGPAPPTEIATNVKRPKNFRCETCNKWFTSHGHLKRHYNTTLHKNMLKQVAEKNGELNEVSLPTVPQPPLPTKAQSPPVSQSQQSVVSPESIIPMEAQPAQAPEPTEVKSAFTPSSSYSLHNNISHQSAVEVTTPQPYTSVPSYQPQYTQSQYTQIQMSHPQYSETPLYSPSAAAFVPTSSSATYHGNFITNPPQFNHAPAPAVNNPVSSSFFHTTPSPMSGGGCLQQQEVQDPHSVQRLSPQQSTQPMSGYQSPVYSFTSEFPGQSNLEHLESFKIDSDEVVSSSTLTFQETAIKEELPASPDTIVGLGNPDCNSEESSRDSVTTSASGNSNPDDVALLQCDQCDKKFNRMCYLTQHKSTNHDGPKPFKCDTCGKKFGLQNECEKHSNKHDGEKPYKCDICPKQFNHKTDLRRHNCLHTGEKPFSCVTCQKGFIRKDHMVKHMATHNKKKQQAEAGGPIRPVSRLHPQHLPNLPPYPTVGHMPIVGDHVPSHNSQFNHHIHLHLPYDPSQQLPPHPSSLPTVY